MFYIGYRRPSMTYITTASPYELWANLRRKLSNQPHLLVSSNEIRNAWLALVRKECAQLAPTVGTAVRELVLNMTGCTFRHWDEVFCGLQHTMLQL